MSSQHRHSIATSCQSNEAAPQGYINPEKRIAQLKSRGEALSISAEPLRNRSDIAFWNRFWKEKVVGGRSKEDELRAIWAKFDEEERRQRLKPNSEAGKKVVSDNHVLGAWEDDHSLHDLSRDEGDW